jgi:endonuclease/exonuclease/phosphatase family metal-dependent hydrolase
MHAGRFKVWGIFIAIPLIVLLLLGVLLVSRRPIGNYSDPAGPFFEGNYVDEQAQLVGSLRVVAWNMHYGEKLDQAIETLESADELQNADVLLLQEMDAAGVETLARRLHYNYIFYPAAIHRQRREEYGNAILSKWPLSDPAKIVLPNWLPGWLQSRNAARATISVGNRDILLYSVHLDTTWMIPKWVTTQGQYLVEEVDAGGHFTILGGDFNTWTPGSVVTLENGLEGAGLERLTEGTGYTFEWSGLRLTLDHIFSMAGLDYQAGVYRQTDASDHYPLWAEITIDAAP